MPLLLRALLLAVIVYEFLSDIRGWRGLSWGHPALRPLLALAALALHPRNTSWRQRAPALALAAFPALLIQATAAGVRRRSLDSRATLRPGLYDDCTVARVDIPMPEAFMPGLYVVPRSGAQAAVAVLHGSGCDKTYFAWRLTNALLRQSMAVLLVDLDGHGENPRVQRYPQMLECAVESVRWLRTRHPRVGIVGISLGGCLAARAAAEGLEIDALAIMEAPPVLRFDNHDRLQEARTLLQPYVIDLLREASIAHLGSAVFRLVRAQRTPSIRAAISTWDLIAACDLCGSLSRLAMPLLLVYGERDAIVKPAQAEEVWRAAPPGATMLLVPDAGHLTLILHPEALQRTAAWMARHLRV
ncbi:MAG: alpha/beta hydrolase [Roseiflexaceae bacterium]|nr:alpha/beta hydrolase [Roseiflexus sp.]MDW8212462.1 alpha/beta hydrolase [Roseiflexaceae bacterium]